MISLCLDTLNHFELKIEGNVTKWEKAYVYWEIFLPVTWTTPLQKYNGKGQIIYVNEMVVFIAGLAFICDKTQE